MFDLPVMFALFLAVFAKCCGVAMSGPTQLVLDMAKIYIFRCVSVTSSVNEPRAIEKSP